MPALRWAEAKYIASQLDTHNRYGVSRSQALVVLAYLCYPNISEVEEYCDQVSGAFVAAQVIIDQDRLTRWRCEITASWRDDMLAAPILPAPGQWRLHVDGSASAGASGVWCHPWSMRNAAHRLQLATRITDIFRDVP